MTNQLDVQSVAENQFGPEFAVPHPDGGVFWVRPAHSKEINGLHSLIASEISQDVGPAETMRAVFEKNPVSFWIIERSGEAGPVPVGMYGFMPLNELGHTALLDKTLNRRNPDLKYIAAKGTKSAAVYIWAMVARRIGRLTFPVIRRALGPDYLDIPFYAIPTTKGGAKAVTDRGFSPTSQDQLGEGELSLLPPLTLPKAPAKPPMILEVAVASNADHLQMAAFIRGATFGAEQNCPYNEEFDGNDFCAMHLIGFVDGEPAATMRVRFFSEFAKLERLAVLERFRKTELKTLIMEKAIEVCRRKGYTQLYGQSQERLVGFYAKFGFRPLQKNRPLVFSDHAYVEIFRELEPADDRITVDSDPYQIIRPEGRWDTAGILEKSAARPATNPQRDRPSGVAG